MRAPDPPRKTKKSEVADAKNLDESFGAAGSIRRAIEILTTRPDVPLTYVERLSVALMLEGLLPKKEQARIERQRLLRNIERGREFFKLGKKSTPPKHRQKLSPLEAIQWSFRKVTADGGLRCIFPSAKAVEEFIKRARKETRR
jgi:hypothetical protein